MKLFFENRIKLNEATSGNVISDARTPAGFNRLMDSVLSQSVLNYRYGERNSTSTSSLVGRDISQEEKDIAIQRGLDAHHNTGTKTVDSVIYLSNHDHGKETNRIQTSGRHNFQDTQLASDLSKLVNEIYSKYSDFVILSGEVHNFSTINALVIKTFVDMVKENPNNSVLLRGYTKQ